VSLLNQRCVLMFAALAAGCASVPAPNALPPDAPQARLRSSMESSPQRQESIAVRMAIQRGVTGPSQPLFTVVRSVSTPSGYVRVPAQEVLVLAYREQASQSQRCEALLKVKLEEGKLYNLVGGATAVAAGGRQCPFAVVDESNGRMVANLR
jgi:hypothetical protein